MENRPENAAEADESVGTQSELGGCSEEGATSGGAGENQNGYADGRRGIPGHIIGNAGALSASPRSPCMPRLS